MEQTIDSKILEQAQKLMAKQEKKQEKITENTRKYQHAIIETLSYDDTARKWECAIRCTVCGDEGRHVYTSDLHQITKCETCAETAAKTARQTKKAELKAAMELLKSQK